MATKFVRVVNSLPHDLISTFAKCYGTEKDSSILLDLLEEKKKAIAEDRDACEDMDIESEAIDVEAETEVICLSSSEAAATTTETECEQMQEELPTQEMLTTTDNVELDSSEEGTQTESTVTPEVGAGGNFGN